MRMIVNSGKFLIKLITALACLKLSSSAIFNGTKLHELMTPEERLEYFGTTNMDVSEYNIMSITWSKNRKRSINDELPVTLRGENGEIINLRLKKSPIPLVHSKTPVHIFETTINGLTYNKEYPFENDMPQLYEDRSQFTSLIVKGDLDGDEYFESGIIGGRHVRFRSVPDRLKRQIRRLMIFPNTNGRIRFYITLRINIIQGTYVNPIVLSSITSNTNSQRTSPAVIYPEILPIVENSLAQKFSRRSDLVDYLVKFWAQVSLVYKGLDQPKFYINLAGVVIAKDSMALQFIKANSDDHGMPTLLNFEGVIPSLGSWLYNLRDYIPLTNYDVAIVHSLRPSGVNSLGFVSQTTTLGLAVINGACQSDPFNRRVNSVGVIYDDGEFGNIAAATHEVAHTFGVDHDNGACSGGYLMSPTVQPQSSKQFVFSDCSLIHLTRFIATNPVCLYNAPPQQ